MAWGCTVEALWTESRKVRCTGQFKAMWPVRQGPSGINYLEQQLQQGSTNL